MWGSFGSLRSLLLLADVVTLRALLLGGLHLAILLLLLHLLVGLRSLRQEVEELSSLPVLGERPHLETT